MLNLGTVLAGRYEVIEKIGAGGMSDVYRALDHALGREVAIKVLKQEFADDAGFVSKFRAEAQSAAGLEHPNIVNIYDVGSESGLYYIVMEYVEGITLKTYIGKKGRLSYNELLSIAIQVGRGIEAAHNKNIIHRDIKPQNILISKEGKVKVTDFGIARAATSNTINADLMGSVHYSSPEQARNGYVTVQSDIYSLGIVMFEMCTGRVPFEGDTTVAIAIQHLQNEMPSPSSMVPDVPKGVEGIIKKATMKSPDKRYASIEDMLNDLKKALVTPNEDIASINYEDSNKTRVITEEEIGKIQRDAGLIPEEPYDEQYDDEYGDEEGYDDDYDDEYDDDIDRETNPQMDRVVQIMGIAAALLIVSIIIYLLGSVAGIFRFGGKSGNDAEETEQTVEETTQETEEEGTTGESQTGAAANTGESETQGIGVPNLLGLTEEQAKTTLNNIGLGIKVIGNASSDTYEEGLIIDQSINEGQIVEANTTINVTVSNGAGNISIPSVVGMTENAAINTLTDAGFKYNRNYEFSATVAQGNVISQTPTAGVLGKKGDTISIVVSQGVESISVPSVVNRTQDEAQNLLTQAKLTVGNITTAHHATVAAGNVISQGIDAGTSVNAGTPVDLVISDGPEPAVYRLSNYVIGTEAGVADVPYPVTITLMDGNNTAISTW
ncbi:MAG: Stk1 family PASTA domain-containing Ser/Thr kinase, partial [Lachnospiraceae bacterium]|nr:Stk1 family PASTA domain-containing Ser/Thr kinase [Lachnospiraceae bacterium]